MNDDSEVEGNILWRKVFGSKRRPKYWYAHVPLLFLFGFMAIASILAVTFEGYVMRPQDWLWVIFIWLSVVALIADLWRQRRKRRPSVSEMDPTES